MSATTTPNATIRRAAEALDLAAAGAKRSATGRWYVYPPEGGNAQRILDNAVLIAETFEEPRPPTTLAPFIASMDPKIAFDLSRLLTAVAEADLAAIHTAAAELAADYLRDKRRCPSCDKDIGVHADGQLWSHGTAAAKCPGEDPP